MANERERKGEEETSKKKEQARGMVGMFHIKMNVKEYEVGTVANVLEC